VDVRIGIIESPRELDVELPDDTSQEEILQRIESTIGLAEAVLWLTDKRGRRVGVPAARIAYVEIGAPERASVGFGAT